MAEASGIGALGLGAAGFLQKPAAAAVPGAAGVFNASPATLFEVTKARLNGPLTPSATLGPYYLANMPVRSDITQPGQAGLPLRLYTIVRSAATCAPIPNAMVEIEDDGVLPCPTTSGGLSARHPRPTAQPRPFRQ